MAWMPLGTRTPLGGVGFAFLDTRFLLPERSRAAAKTANSAAAGGEYQGLREDDG